MTCLLIVDVYNDFCPGGSLAVADGDKIVPVINKAQAEYDFVVASRDWHPANHKSFVGVDGKCVNSDNKWPAHCVQGTSGAEFHPDLHVPKAIVSKGMNEVEENYSAFDRPELLYILKEQKIQRVDVVGLAFDFCVKATALAAKKHFPCVRVLTSMSASVFPQNFEANAQELKEAGVEVI